MCVGDICTEDVVTVAPEDSLNTAARLMREKHVGMLVVVQPVAGSTDRAVQGVLTDRDIVITVIGRDADPKGLKVMDVMSHNPLLVARGHSVAAALRMMRSIGVRRVPVVGVRNELVGVLSIDDALDAMADQLSAISGAIRAEQNRERVTRP